MINSTEEGEYLKANAAQSAKATRTQQHSRIMDGPVLGLILSMATPNAMAFLVQAAVNMTEVWFIGQLGTTALAAMGFVFPGLMLMQMLSGGAMGGAVASSIARCLGRGEVERAHRILWHAIAIALAAGLLFLTLYQIFGTSLLLRMGASGKVLAEADRYAGIIFTASTSIWMTSILAGTFRGMGEMRIPAAIMAGAGIVQVFVSGALVLGWFGAPRLGMLGAALSVTGVASLSAIVTLTLLAKSKVPVRLSIRHLKFEAFIFKDIFRIGALAGISPFLTITSIMVINSLISRYGDAMVAGYGIGARLEFLLVPMVFGFGAAMNTMVGMNVGAGNIRRAEHIAFVGGSSAACLTGFVGLFLAIFPELWIGLFTEDPAAIAAGARYLQYSGWAFAFQGMGLSLYFASQGAGNVLWAVIANFARFAVGAGGAVLLTTVFALDVNWIFICLALGMFCYGSITAGSIWLGAWRPR